MPHWIDVLWINRADIYLFGLIVTEIIAVICFFLACCINLEDWDYRTWDQKDARDTIKCLAFFGVAALWPLAALAALSVPLLYYPTRIIQVAYGQTGARKLEREKEEELLARSRRGYA